jgi:hypothetical protein
MKKIAFTIVLNGMPFIKTQYDIIPKVFDEWYIVEGACRPHHDTSWCSTISSEFYNHDKLSIDGTSEFLDSIASDKIIIIRKGDYWDGKLEMCNSFMDNLSDCVLMQFDVDEIWDVEILNSVLNYSVNNDYFDGMLFKCNYFMGPSIKKINDGGYADNPYEWMRLWKFRNSTRWLSHEPPRILGCDNLLSKEFTKSNGWIFDHYAYVTEEQLKFKENFYGYSGALESWKRLQNNDKFPCMASEFLPWVTDNTILDKI